MRLAKQVERFLLVLGVLLIMVFVAAYLHRVTASRAEMKQFREAQERQVRHGFDERGQGLHLDFSLWSDQRIAAYKDTLKQNADAPMAILRITKVGLEVPILDGTSDFALNRGVGHIEGTENPGGHGNIGIAGHRDGFFRALKDVGPGDTIEVETLDHADVYKVYDVVIVSPSDTTVLKPRSFPSLTLVTCYPFYFVGSAPKRYIVEASLTGSSQRHTVAEEQAPGFSNFEPKQRSLSPQSQRSIKEISQ